MPKLPGGKMMVFRAAALLLILGAIVAVNCLFANGRISQYYSKALIAGPIIMSVLMVFFLKAEYDKVDEYRYYLLGASLLIGLVLVIGIGYGEESGAEDIIIWKYYVPTTIALFFLIICWQYTLTIYKNEMNRHLIGFLIFEGLYLGFGWEDIGPLTLIPALLTLIAVFLNQYAVNELKKKNLLKMI